MTKFSTEAQRMADWTIGVGYGDDASKAEMVNRKLCDEDDRILKGPEVFIAISELADVYVDFTVRAWVKAEDYWGVFFDMNKKEYEVFVMQGLNILYHQIDVHVHKKE